MAIASPEIAAVARLVRHLEEAGIEYMVVGSVASTVYGEPRSTMDVDMVIDPTPATLERLLRALPEGDYYVDVDAAQQAVRGRRMFNLLDQNEVLKLDLIIKKPGAYDAEAFSRRVKLDANGALLYFSSPEDVILAKLRWAKETDSPRQLRDVVGIIRVVGPGLDLAYLDRWAAVLGVDDRLKALLSKPRP